MENEKRKMENEERSLERVKFSAVRFPLSIEKNCPACGNDAQRNDAKFCSVCGKFLGEDYQPLDSLRASYRLQGKSFASQKALKTEKHRKEKNENLFEENKNPASDAARAFVVYSLVPYLGILFCPFAVLTGGIGVFVSYRKPYLGGGRTSAFSVALGFIIFAVQIFLWWLLYIIPELGRKI
ncbi:MAG: hypothetical protein M3033_17325 [Acidobacteriota bacterium]|nr:hypothetical protein [Acidobacteriota bacterium]